MNDDGVSAVISAVLMFALFSTASIMWTVNTLPEWIADNEEAQQDGVADELSRLQGALEALSASGEQGPGQVTIDLQPTRVPLVQQVVAKSSLHYIEGGGIDATFTGTQVHMLNGESQGSPSQPIASFTADDVTSLRSLTFAFQSDLNGNGDAAMVLSFISGTGSVSVTLTHTETTTRCANNAMQLTVGTSDRLLLCDLSDSMTGAFEYDLLAAGTGVQGAIAGIGTPFTMTGWVVGTAPRTDLAAVWTSEDGQLQASGTGAATSYTLAETSGRIEVQHRPQHFTQQHVAWDLGGIGVLQGDGQVMRQAGQVDIWQANGRNVLAWTMVDLQGDEGSVQSDRATITVEHLATSDVFLSATSAQFVLTSTYADAWAELLDTKIAAGTAVDATASSDGDAMTLDLGGTDPWWIHVRVIHAKATLS